MDVQQVTEVLKGIGHRAFNITDALSNPSLSDNKRIEYKAHRIQWGLERKIILVVQANEYTAPLLFPTGFRNASAGVNIFLIAKHGELHVAPDTSAATIVAFARGHTQFCSSCKKGTDIRTTCRTCAYTLCDPCVKETSANAIWCQCELEATGRLPSALSAKVEVTPWGMDHARADMVLPYKDGAQVTQVMFDPNIVAHLNEELLKATSQERANLGQFIISIYQQRLLAKTYQATSVAIYFGGKDLVYQKSLNLSRRLIVDMYKNLEIVFLQSESAWEAAGRFLRAHSKVEMGSYALVIPSRREKKIIVAFHLIYEVVRDYLIVTNGWVCANCQQQATQRCLNCSVSRYCSRQCQAKHWPSHRDVCHAMKKDIDRCRAMQKVDEKDRVVRVK